MKPCPFCGGKSMKHDSVDSCGWVKCNECGAISPKVFSNDDLCRMAQAEAMWNKRA